MTICACIPKRSPQVPGKLELIFLGFFSCVIPPVRICQKSSLVQGFGEFLWISPCRLSVTCMFLGFIFVGGSERVNFVWLWFFFAIMIKTCIYILFKPTECIIPRMSSNVHPNSGWYWYTDLSVVQVMCRRTGGAVMETRGTWELYSFLSMYCENYYSKIFTVFYYNTFLPMNPQRCLLPFFLKEKAILFLDVLCLKSENNE